MAQKKRVFIKSGYHVNSSEDNQYLSLWVESDDEMSIPPDIYPYEYALYQLPKSHEDNPSGYMISIPAMMDTIPYVRVWKIVQNPALSNKKIGLYINLWFRKLAWAIVSLFMGDRVGKEKLMRLSGLMNKEDTLYYKWHPDEIRNKIYYFKNYKKDTDLGEDFFS